MFKRQRGYQLLALCAALCLALAACFRDTSEAIQQQPVARQVTSPTAVEEATSTSLPPTATETPVPTEQEADQFALTATALIALQTQQASGPQTSSGAAGDQGLAVTGGGATAIPVARATIPPGEDCVHEIRSGETLFQLSLAYGVTVDDIARLSEISNPDRIAVGQRVVIPACGTTGFIPPPTSIPPPTVDPATIPPTSVPVELELASAEDTRDTLIEQAQASLLDNAQTGVETDFSIQAAPLATPAGTYTVQQYDTLYGIAVELGTTVEVLATLNDITDVDSLDAGVVLITP
ncbi:MAG: LysM peptidoglycan-binding domain-containing protein [Chloroflexota bacterium]|nr:LysM peptidoglycan-binding domain-containing protein [Chloroflexota bacterium]MDE2853984.1 LysM peptidoglycan-binding domain-containing protein [Chloroflexota bacterium]MDE2946887.1 LysM peptidoglycan-binding domain-containing protein [Chloroflexota bacterium]